MDENTNDARPQAGRGLLHAAQQRRDFLRAAGLGGAALALAACGAEVSKLTAATAPGAPASGGAGGTVTAGATVVLDFSTDIGVLNYAYALEQLEAAFYAQVVANAAFASIFSATERRLLTDVSLHEAIHRDFFKAALAGAAIPNLTPNFSAINFADRTSVLSASRDFEDLGVSAYNGAGQYLRNAVYLTLAGKIVSVEARHASAIRDLISPKSGSFAPNSFDAANAPDVVLNTAKAFVTDSISVINVPALT